MYKVILFKASQVVFLALYLTSQAGATSDNSEHSYKSAQRLEKLKRVPKQIHENSAVVNAMENDDHKTEETGFFGGGGGQAHAVGHSKYFQYQHVPHKDHYEFGHKRGNKHHFIERHEKAAPHHGIFKTKVRWGDKHGGYGEHYWDYNHAGGKHDNDDEGGGGATGDENQDEGDADDTPYNNGGYTNNVPDYIPKPDIKVTSILNKKVTATENQLPSSEQNTKVIGSRSDWSQQFNGEADSGSFDIMKSAHDKTNNIFGESSMGKNVDKLTPSVSLVYDIESGTIVDEASGKSYVLQPIN